MFHISKVPILLWLTLEVLNQSLNCRNHVLILAFQTRKAIFLLFQWNFNLFKATKTQVRERYPLLEDVYRIVTVGQILFYLFKKYRCNVLLYKNQLFNKLFTNHRYNLTCKINNITCSWSRDGVWLSKMFSCCIKYLKTFVYICGK